MSHQDLTTRRRRAAACAAVLGTLFLGLSATVAGAEPGWQYVPAPQVVEAVPPLPGPDQFAVRLYLDDDAAEGAVGVAAQAARQFLWFNRFTPGGPFSLEEVWVLFPSGPNVNVGGAVQLAIYEDQDGDPTNGATLLASFDETIQAADGNTFSVYSLPSPVAFNGVGDLLVGVVPRFIQSGVTPPTQPAAIDTTASQGRSWLASWTGDPPDPPALTPPPDQQIVVVDSFLAGNWMIRAFGSTPAAITVPTLGGAGLAVLVVALALASFFLLRRRRAAVLLLTTLVAWGWAQAAAAQTTIDSFTTNQASILAPPGGASNVATGGADILGGRRYLSPTNLSGAGPTTVAVSGGNLTFSVTNTTPDSRGLATVRWDGTTGIGPSPTPSIGPVNLTSGGASGLRIRVASTSVAGVELEMTVYTDSSNLSRAGRRLPLVAAPTDFFLPFSEFRLAGGSGADFTTVRALVLVVRGTEVSASIDEIVTGTPSLAATKVDTQTVDNDSDTRVDPGDRVRYTITLTNTGSEAKTVHLADTIDANTTLVGGTVSSTPIARNDQYLWFGNVSFATDGSPAKPHLLANDSDPDGNTLTVVGGSFPVATVQGGSLTLVDASTGAFSYSPPVGFSGVDSFNYTVQDPGGLMSTATATLVLNGVVWFVDDSNTTPPFNGTQTDPFPALASLNGAGGAGDADGPNDTIFVFDDDGTPYAGGLELEASQQLIGEGEGLVLGGTTIVPAGGRPQITNAGGVGVLLSTNNVLRGFDTQASAGVGIAGSNFGTLTAANVNVLAAGGAALDLNTGVLASTFGTLASTGTGGQRGILLQAVSGSLTASTTTLTNPTTQGIRVANSPGVSLNFGATTITDNAIGSGPTATGIDVATGNGGGSSFTFSSLSMVTDAGTGILANNSGTLNIAGTSNSLVANGGPALDISSTSLGSGATFSTLSSTNSLTKGINLDTVSGGLVANGGSLSNAGGISFDLNAGSSTVTYAGSISNIANVLLIDVSARTGGTVTFSGNLSSTSAGNGINVASNTGGTINFSGSTKTLTTGADAAVTLSSNGGATINFTGGGLAISTTSGTGFNATGGAAAITVQGSGNTIASTTGTALNVASTTIGASGLTFQSIASNGAASGIVLSSTGANGGLTVTGTGSANSGGTIQSSTGPGISLSSTQSVSLSWMRIQNGGDDGIRGSNVNGFSLIQSTVSANGNAANENGLDFTELAGSAQITSSTITGSATHNAIIVNSSATLNPLTVTGSTVSSNSSTLGDDGLQCSVTGTGSITVSVTGSIFTANRGDHFQAVATNAGNLNVTFTGNTLTGGNASPLGQGVTVNAAAGVPGYTGSVVYNISNNTINGAVLNAIQTNLGTSAAGATMSGTIANNQIGTAATFQSCSTQGSGIGLDAHGNGTHTVAVTGNTIRQCFDRGISVLANDGSGTLNMTVTGNTLLHTDGTNSREAFFVNNGSADPNIFGVPDAHFVCLTLGGAGANANTLSHGPGAPDDFRLRQRFNSTIRLPGYAGAATDTAAVVTFVKGNNLPAGTLVGSATVNSPPGGGFVGGAACPLP